MNETDPLFEASNLVVNQKVKIIEVHNEYTVFHGEGEKVGAVRQTGQNALKKIVRVVGNADQFFTHTLEVVDGSGQVRLKLVRPRKFLKSKLLVSDGHDRAIGRIVQLNAIGKIRFNLEDTTGSVVGTLNGLNWRAWNFSIADARGEEIATISKTWEGLAKTLFTTADNYRVERTMIPAEPLNSLVVASALAVDTALKQDSRGLS